MWWWRYLCWRWGIEDHLLVSPDADTLCCILDTVNNVTCITTQVITSPPNGPVSFCWLASVVVVVCNAGSPVSRRESGNSVWEHCRRSGRPATGRVDGRRAGGWPNGRAGGWHCTVGQSCYVPLRWHIVYCELATRRPPTRSARRRPTE